MQELRIAGRPVGPGHPMYTIAEVSGNHNGSLERAKAILRAAAAAGASAVKLQTYTADTLTIASDAPPFRIQGTLWAGRTLHELYQEAYTPWEWHESLFAEGRRAGVTVFSSPFDRTAIDLLEDLGAPAYKIASFEMVDPALVEAAASTGKPLIVSTGMASAEEIDDAVEAARRGGCRQLALLRCNSAYPAPPDEMDLRTILDMQARWQVPVGLSDHTLGHDVALAARCLGASLLEKHICLSRDEPGPDSAFSMEPAEWAAMEERLRQVDTSLGQVRYGPSSAERASLAFRRSLFVVEDVRAGEEFTARNVRSIRPGHGLAPKHLPEVLGKRAARDLQRGTPLSWDAVR